jgi:uncharacterized membrane protein
MSKVEDFLSKEAEQEIVSAIKEAEKNTSGEIRVHIENTTSIALFARAVEVFLLLEMDKTSERNGVLIYLAIQDKKFVIYGDKGIDEKVSDGFWNSTRDTIQGHFKNNNFKQGLVDGILKAGNELKKHFPIQKNDQNELSNEISIG